MGEIIYSHDASDTTYYGCRGNMAKIKHTVTTQCAYCVSCYLEGITDSRTNHHLTTISPPLQISLDLTHILFAGRLKKRVTRKGRVLDSNTGPSAESESCLT